MTTSLPSIALICLRTWRKTIRRPVALTFSFFQPVLWMLLFGFLFHRFEVGPEARGASYLDFLVPGISAMTVLFGASQSGIGLIRDLQTGFLSRLLRTPAGPATLLGGKILADVVRVQCQALVIILIGRLVGATLHLDLSTVFASLVVLGLFAIAMTCVSCVVALISRAQESMAAFVHLVNMPLLFTSSALVPARQMPDWLAAAARFNPLTLAVDACRGALVFGDFSALPRAVAWLGLLAAVVFAVAVGVMGRAARET